MDLQPSELTSRRRRRLVMAGVTALAIGALAAGPAAADLVTGFIQRAPESAQEADRMEVFHKGQPFTWAQIYAMQEDGNAVMTLEEPTTYTKGQAFAFDTEAEQNQWVCTHIGSQAKLPKCRNTPFTTVPTSP